jgi:hypothetical protein
MENFWFCHSVTPLAVCMPEVFEDEGEVLCCEVHADNSKIAAKKTEKYGLKVMAG